jgi:hypothetical protein
MIMELFYHLREHGLPGWMGKCEEDYAISYPLPSPGARSARLDGIKKWRRLPDKLSFIIDAKYGLPGWMGKKGMKNYPIR